MGWITPSDDDIQQIRRVNEEMRALLRLADAAQWPSVVYTDVLDAEHLDCDCDDC